MPIEASDVLFTIFESITFLLLYLFLTQNKRFIWDHKAKCLIYIILHTLTSCWPDSVVLPLIRIIIFLAVASILLAYLTQISFYTSILSTVIILLFFFTTELIICTVIAFLFKIDLNSIMNNPKLTLLLGIIVKSIQFLAAVIFFRSNIKLKKLNELKKPGSIFVILLVQSFTICIAIISLTLTSKQYPNTVYFNSFLIILYFFFLIITYLEIMEREKKRVVQQKLEAQEEYIKNMETVISIIRREKHDLSNHLNTIMALCTQNKNDTVEKIKNYIGRVTNNLISSYNFYNTGNDYVDGLLAVKSNHAFENNIHLEVELEVPLNDLVVSDNELTSIISNIVDNAFDAVSSIQGYQRIVSISTFMEGADFCISISNNGPVISQKDLDLIFKSGFTTKSTKTMERGFGLNIVQQLVKKNNGTIIVNSTDEETEFLIKFEGRRQIDGKSCSENHKLGV